MFTTQKIQKSVRETKLDLNRYTCTLNQVSFFNSIKKDQKTKLPNITIVVTCLESDNTNNFSYVTSTFL